MKYPLWQSLYNNENVKWKWKDYEHSVRDVSFICLIIKQNLAETDTSDNLGTNPFRITI